MRNKRLVIYSGIYNEARFFRHMIEWVLSQTYSDFDFIISDNHSTDGSSQIIREYAARDSRIKLIAPRTFLSSLHHGQFIVSSLKGLDYAAALYVGGHDLISPDYVMSMLESLMQNPSCVIAYPRNAFEIDSDNNILRRWGSSPQTIGLAQPFKTITTLLNITHNIPLYGLWRYDVFNLQAELPRCIGGDHFFVAKTNLYGDLLEVPTGDLYLRRVQDAGNYTAYQKKHFGDQINVADDMLLQLEMLANLVRQACSGYSQVTCDTALASAVMLYIIRFSSLLESEEHRQQFFSHPQISAAMSACAQSGALLSAVLKLAPL